MFFESRCFCHCLTYLYISNSQHIVVHVVAAQLTLVDGMSKWTNRRTSTTVSGSMCSRCSGGRQTINKHFQVVESARKENKAGYEDICVDTEWVTEWVVPYLYVTWTVDLVFTNQKIGIFIPCLHAYWHQLQYHISACAEGVVPKQRGSLSGKGTG